MAVPLGIKSMGEDPDGFQESNPRQAVRPLPPLANHKLDFSLHISNFIGEQDSV
jgi:hypothetical protein